MDDSGEGRTLQDCAGEHRPGLNTSIMLHLGTALRAAITTACHHRRFRTTSSMRLYRWIGDRGR